MANKNLLLGLLALWLMGSAWWQVNKIMKCDAVIQTAVSDSTAVIAEPIIADTLVVDTTQSLTTVATGTTEDDLAKSQKYESLFKPMDLYFRTNEANYIKTDDNQKFIDEAKNYLKEHPDKRLQLTGHTDSDGAEAANQKLSEKRAADVKKQLVAKGFNAQQIVTEAKGETQPIASNDTPEGKKANRRVGIVVNQ